MQLVNESYMYMYICTCTHTHTHIQIVDESEMVVYRAELDQWMADQEEAKHAFTITHSDTLKRNKTNHKVRN